MTNREELAGRLEKYLAERAKMRQLDPDMIHGLHMGDHREAALTVADLTEAAAALRQSPSVEEVARVIDPAAWDKFDHMIGKTYAGWIPMDQRREEQKELVASSLAKAAEIDRLYRGSKE